MDLIFEVWMLFSNLIYGMNLTQKGEIKVT